MTRDLDRSESFRILMICALFMVAGCAVAMSPDSSAPFVPPPGATSDGDLFEKLIEGVHNGGSFYDVSHKELLGHGYPTRSIFNWRWPTLTWLLANLPQSSWGKVALALLATYTFFLLFQDLARQLGMTPALLGGFALLGSLAWCLGEKPYLFTDTWSGVLIAFSIGCLSRGKVALGVSAGILAVCFRELALPYVVGSLGFAILKRDRKEAVGWALGCVLFAVFEALHAQQVLARITAVDQAIPGGWVRFGGLRFLLATSQMNLLLMPISLVGTVIYLTIATLGLYRAETELGRRTAVIVALYMAAFSIAGAPFNFYWGLLTAPLLAIGFAHGVFILPKLIDTAINFPAPSPAVSR